MRDNTVEMLAKIFAASIALAFVFIVKWLPIALLMILAKYLFF